MRKDILSQREDELFSSLVIDYNRADGKSREDEDFIKSRTKELVWRICRERLFVADDLISSLYINIHDDLDKIISAYRISLKTFNHYLKQVCIYRIRRVRQENRFPDYLDLEYAGEAEDSLYTLDDYSAVYNGEEIRNGSRAIFNSGRYLDMDMKAAADYITHTQNRNAASPLTKREEALRGMLDNRYFRRNFLFFILALPAGENEKEAENYSRVFQTDEGAFSRLLALKNELILHNYPNREKNLELAAMHWRMMARIKNSMYSAGSNEEYRMLNENYMAHVRCHRNRIRDAQRSMRGIIHSDIASILGVCRTTVTMGIRKVREELERINRAYSV